MKTTLIAVTGLSPAILTETLWALAKRKPAILPERVVLITTATGALKLEEQLFTPLPDWNGQSVWETLRHILRAKPHQLIAEPPHIISISDGDTGRAVLLDDIRTAAENAAAAEFIFARVWDIVRHPDHTLIASIAGGRKTMGALLHSAVSLIGREQDLITHILVNPPYDTLPGFFFPAQPACPLHDTRTAKAHLAADAVLDLAEVPFVPLRNRFKDLQDLPASFLAFRDSISTRLKQDAQRPIPIRIDHQRSYLEVDGQRHPVRARTLIVLHFILQANLDNTIPPDQKTAADQLAHWYQKNKPSLGHIDSANFDESDIRRELNHLRTILKHSPWQPAQRTLRQQPFHLLQTGTAH